MSNLITTFPGSAQGLTLFEQQLHYNLSLAYDLFSSEIYRPTKEIGNTVVVSCRYGQDADNIERFIYTLAMPVNVNWRTSGNEIWADTLQIENVPIPSGYMT